MPEQLISEDGLDAYISRPYPQLVEMMTRLDGDIMILGAGGKMGPALAQTAVSACKESGINKRIIAVSQFSRAGMEDSLNNKGIETIRCDLLDPAQVSQLPHAENIVFMAGRKFGEIGSEPLTWMLNTIVPANTAGKFKNSRIVVFSTGCVYELRSADSGGSKESDPPRPVGEYANSCLGRERIFQYYSEKYNTPVLIYRLNYSIDLRYGVLTDIARDVFNDNPIDLSVGVVNIIWQGDAVNRALLCLEHAASPAKFLNVTGPETIPVKELAEKFGKMFDKHVKYKNKDTGKAYLSNAENSIKLFGPPTVSPEYMIKWVSDWIIKGGQHLDKPTHFQVTDGQFLD